MCRRGDVPDRVETLHPSGVRPCVAHVLQTLHTYGVHMRSVWTPMYSVTRNQSAPSEGSPPTKAVTTRTHCTAAAGCGRDTASFYTPATPDRVAGESLRRMSKLQSHTCVVVSNIDTIPRTN